MELNFKLTYNIPEELIKALGINEDTLFCGISMQIITLPQI